MTGTTTTDDPPEPQTDRFFETFDTYVRMAARGEKDGVIIVSNPGLGKSERIDTILEEELQSDESPCADYSFRSGYMSPLALFKTLHKNQQAGNVLVLDDVEGLTQNDSSASLLKAALEGRGAGEQRRVEWDSSTDRLPDDVPAEFIFDGTIVMIFNEAPTGTKHWKAVKSRCFDWTFALSHEQRLDLLREVAKAPYEDLSYDERQEVCEWVIDQVTSDMTVDLRTLFHTFDLYRSSVTEDDEWKIRAAEQMNADSVTVEARDSRDRAETIVEAARQFERSTQHDTTEFFERLGLDAELELVKYLRGEYQMSQDQIEVWTELTGKSRKTFYRRRGELKERGEDV